MATPERPADAGTRGFFDHAPCGLLVTDPDGVILRVNATFCDWLGIARESLVGTRRFQDLLTVGGRIFHQTHWAPLLHMQGSIAEVKLDLAREGAPPIPMVMNAVRQERDGLIVHDLALFVAEDRHAYERELLAARKRAEQLLAEQRMERDARRAAAEDRALLAEQMVGIVSHDLRNPLSTIRMGTEILKMLGLPGRHEQILGNIDRAGLRALGLINDLLDFTRLRLGQGIALSPRPMDLHAVVATQLAELELAHPQARIEHRRDGDGTCVADPARLGQLVGNLVSNALAYGTPGSPVVVATATSPAGFSIAVRNDGEPIPEALRAALFQPMVRGAETGAEARSVGLGLYIVAEVARAHGGTMRLESTAAGTEFIASFPSGEG